jgi:hypothetical protein
VVEELPTGDGTGLIPEPAKVIFDAPRPAGSQLLFLQSIQFFLTFFIELLGIEKEVITHALETIVTLLHQFEFKTTVPDTFFAPLTPFLPLGWKVQEHFTSDGHTPAATLRCRRFTSSSVMALSSLVSSRIRLSR